MRAALRAMFGFVLLVWGAAVSVQAADYYVDQRAANASDENAGTAEQPWKTLGEAADTAVAGDTVWIKAGIYLETLRVTKSGELNKPIVFQAFGDHPVLITSPKYAVTGWQKVEGAKNIYEAPQPDVHNPTKLSPPFLLAVDGKAVSGPAPGPGSPYQIGLNGFNEVTDETVNCFIVQDDRIRLNIGGDNPADHQVEAVPRSFCGVVLDGSYIVVRGLRMFDVSGGVLHHGEYNLVEDCVAQELWNDNPWDGAFTLGGKFGTVRRCTAIDTRQVAFSSGGACDVVEECLAVHPGVNMPNRITPEEDEQGGGIYYWLRSGYMVGNSGSRCATFRYNVCADSGFFGWWCDINAQGLYVYGNAIVRSRDNGMYNEAFCNDSTILYNTSVGNLHGFAYRLCERMLAQYNYIADNEIGVCLFQESQHPGPTDNIFRKNLVLRSVVARKSWRWANVENLEGHSASADAQKAGIGDPQVPLVDQLADSWDLYEDNVYTIKPGGVFRQVPHWGASRDDLTIRADAGRGKEYRTLAEYQAETGQERGSQERPAGMEEFGLGLYTFRVPYSDTPYEPVVIVGNPARTAIHLEPRRWGYEPYFWKSTDNRGFDLRVGYRPYLPGGGPRLTVDTPAVVWFTTIGSDFSEEAQGFWSPSLPTVPGAKIDFSFLVTGEDLTAATEDAVVAWVRFSSLTNQNVTRQFVLGKDDKGQLVGTGPYKGTFPWHKVTGTVVAPPDAERFAAFFGIRPCSGTARFADIDLQTEPGEAPPEGQPKMERPKFNHEQLLKEFLEQQSRSQQ